MVLEGLALLLRDMNCDVTVVRDLGEYPPDMQALVDCPQLIILPRLLDSGVAGERLIGEIRERCQARTPAILLASEHRLGAEPPIHDNIAILADGLNPQRLRKLIVELLALDWIGQPS